MRFAAAAGTGVLFAALSGAGCSAANSSDPACTNESSAAAYGDAGVLPLRALPIGFPCATSAVCAMTVDDCAGDWPDASATPASSSPNATPFVCECPDGVWTCTAQIATPPVCAAVSSPDASDLSDAGDGDAGDG